MKPSISAYLLLLSLEGKSLREGGWESRARDAESVKFGNFHIEYETNALQQQN